MNFRARSVSARVDCLPVANVPGSDEVQADFSLPRITQLPRSLNLTQVM